MKKWLSVVMTVVLMLTCLTAFVGCGGKETPDKDATDLGLKTPGVLVMGTNAEFPPFEYEEGGAVVGLDADMMAEVAKRLELTLEIKNLQFDSLPEALTANEIDCIAAGLTVNPEREETMAFTEGYYLASQTIIVKSDSTITNADGLKDKKIGCQSGTTGQWTAEEYTDVSNVVGFANGALAVEALLNNQVDAVIIDNNPAKEYGTQHDGKVTLLEGQFEDETYAVAVKKENTALRDAINNAINEMKADGTFDKIVDKYIK